MLGWGERVIRLSGTADGRLCDRWHGPSAVGDGPVRSRLAEEIRERLASSDEQLRLLRTRLHDTTLQTLEFIANGGWMGAGADWERLMRLAAREATELRHMLEGLTRDEPLTLTASLQETVDAARAYGDERIELVVRATDDSVESLAAVELAAAAREAITNARKHADASRIVVHLEECEGAAMVSIRDDGCGADLQTIQPGLGLGTSIRSRLMRLGGAAHLDSAPGEGFLVTLTLPRAHAGGEPDEDADASAAALAIIRSRAGG
jgi:signal transduction histidine kinase